MSTGGDEPLVIKVRLDASEAMAGQKAVGDAADRATARADAAAKKMASAQAREARKAADAQAREAKRAAEASFVSLQSVQSAAIKFHGDVGDAAKKSADRQAAEAKRAADAAAREARKAADAQAAATKKSFDARFVSLGSVQQSGIKLQDKLAEAAKKSGEEQRKAAEAAAAKWNVAHHAGENFLGSLRNLAIQVASIQTLSAAFDAVARAIGDAQKKTTDYAKDLLKVKDDLKELATLRGLASASDEFIKDIAEFGRQTGLSISQSDEFQRQFFGSLAGGKQKGNIDDATAERLMVEGGKVASRQTKDLLTRGDLLGILSQFRKYDRGEAGVKQALSDAEAIRIGLTEGRGDDAPLTKSLLHVAGQLAGEGGMVGTLPELAALLGVTSLSAGPGLADTRTEQLARGLRGGTDKQMGFLKDFAGIKELDSLETRLDKIIPKLREQQAAGRDLTTFLIESGMNEEQSRALAEITPNYEMLKKRFAAARQAPSGADIMAESERQAALDPLQRSKVAEAERRAAQLMRGQERQAIVPEVTAAEAQLIRERVDTDYSPATLFGNFLRYVGSAGQFGPMEVRSQERALENLRTRTGVEAPRASFGLGSLLFGGGATDVLTSGTPLASGVRALTGLTAAETAQIRQVEEQRTTNQLLKNIHDRLAPPAVGPLAPARPGPGWTR